jgi:hypothetical protein
MRNVRDNGELHHRGGIVRLGTRMYLLTAGRR